MSILQLCDSFPNQHWALRCPGSSDEGKMRYRNVGYRPEWLFTCADASRVCSHCCPAALVFQRGCAMQAP